MSAHATLSCLLGLAACAQPPKGPWRLVGVYDATALQTLADPSAQIASTYTWVADPAMSETCGPHWTPEGLGVTEAVALGNRLTPALAVLLAEDARGSSSGAPLSRDELVVGYDPHDGREPWTLEPAVLPMALQVELEAPDEGDASPTSAGAVGTALEQQVVTSLCLEHKIGRAWVGGDQDQVRQALLLGRGDARASPGLFFVGFGAPVPTLLGPERACLSSAAPASARPAGLDAVAELQPGDIWNAGLPRCPDATQSAQQAHGADLQIAPTWFGASPALPDGLGRWRALDLRLHRDAGALRLTATLDGAPIVDEEVPRGVVRDGTSAVVSYTLPDVLARLPRTYPRITDLHAAGLSQGEGGEAYTLLLIPAWQLLGAQVTGDGQPVDVVGEVLRDLSRLSVAVRASHDEQTWWEINPHWFSAGASRLSWGYPLGGTEAEGPLALVGPGPLGGGSSSNAYRASEEGLVLASFLVLTGLALATLGRLSDLWRRSPQLRLERWVDRPPGKEEP